MKNLKNILPVLLLCLTAAGCTKTKDAYDTLEHKSLNFLGPKIQEAHKGADAAYIIMASSLDHQGVNNKTVETTWQPVVAGGKDLTLTPLNRAEYSRQDYQVAKVAPGTYVLKTFSATYEKRLFARKSDLIHVKPESATNMTKPLRKQPAFFQVNPGEVAYIGDLNIKAHEDQTMTLSVQESPKAIKKFMKKHFPKLSRDMKTKLMTVRKSR